MIWISRDTRTVWFEVTASGLTGTSTGLTFHGPAAVGATASSGSPISSLFLGTPQLHSRGRMTEVLNATLQNFLDGLMYVNVRSTSFPSGEIRGQFTFPRAGELGYALMNPASEVPPVTNAPGAVATAVVRFVEGGTAVWYDITLASLTGDIIFSHFHGPANTTSVMPPLFTIPLATGNKFHLRGVWRNLTSANIVALTTQMIYLNSHTALNRPGEVRGQLLGLRVPTTVTPANPSFEDDIRTPEIRVIFEAEGWAISGNAGTWLPRPESFDTTFPLPAPADGLQALFVRPGSVIQQNIVAFRRNTRYVMTVAVGRRKEATFVYPTFLIVSLYTSVTNRFLKSVTLTSSSPQIQSGKFNDVSVEYEVTDSSVLGEDLQVRFSAEGSATSASVQAVVDNVRLTIDENECAAINPCHPQATCAAEASGAFSCACKAGWTGSGFDCVAIPRR